MPCACREQRSSSNRHLRPRAVTRRGRHGHQELRRVGIHYGRPAGATARWRHAPPRPPSGWTGPTRGTWRGAMSLVKALTTTLLTKLRWDSGRWWGLLAMQGLSDAAASGPRVAMSGLGAWPHGGSVLPGPQTNSSSRRSCTCDSTFSRACVQDDRGSRGSPPRARSTYRVSLILSGAEQVRIQPATASAAPELASRALTCRAVLLPRAVGIRHPASLSRCP